MKRTPALLGNKCEVKGIVGDVVWLLTKATGAL